MPSEEYIRKNYIQEDGLRAVLRRIYPEYLDDLHDETETWFQDVREVTKFTKDIEQFSEEMFNKSGIKKPQLVELLGQVCIFGQ